MSALADQLRTMAEVLSRKPGGSMPFGAGAADGWREAARLVEREETASLARSAEGKGPHVARALRWLAEDPDALTWASEYGQLRDHLLVLARAAERSS